MNKFYEFIDPCEEHWETRRDRDALAEHEEAGRRQEELKKVRDARFRKASTYMKDQFLKLLDPVPIPADQPVADPVGGEQPCTRVAPVENDRGANVVPAQPDPRVEDERTGPTPSDVAIQIELSRDDFLLD